MPLLGGYDASKLKAQLKMAAHRFGISSNKKMALIKQQSREVARLLAEDPPREERARIRVESMIRDERAIEAYGILGLTCDLLYERIHLISRSSVCPHDLVESISTLIWSSEVADVPELIEARKQLRFKYGRDFEGCALRNVGGVVNERVSSRLGVHPPSAYDVQVRMERISDEHGIEWRTSTPLRIGEMHEPMPAPIGLDVLAPPGGGGWCRDATTTTAAAARGGRMGSSFVIPSAPPMSPTSSSLIDGRMTTTFAPRRPDEYVTILSNPRSHNDDARDNNSRMIADDIDEEDIYVPAYWKSKAADGVDGVLDVGRDVVGDDRATTTPHGMMIGRGGRRHASSVSEITDFSSTRHDDDDGGRRAVVEDSFDELAARFASLQR
ncbi:hypothetical protein ACHAXA_011654 [Cyclostephanos tholiformis]|uniref:IST1-like protein n=1 Tax=Cyclostephanos tholiformis TaxID=382380 RepID=A0ABD3SEF7_9STRA